jgi:hypothetical protein
MADAGAAWLFRAIGLGAGDGDFAAGAFTAFVATGAGLLLLAGAAFFGGATLRAGALPATCFGAGFLVATGFFFAATLPFAGAARRGAGLAAGRARGALAADFFEVLWGAGFFTDSPRNGTTRVARDAHREGGAGFGRRGL